MEQEMKMNDKIKLLEVDNPHQFGMRKVWINGTLKGLLILAVFWTANHLIDKLY